MDHDEQPPTAFWRSPAGMTLFVALLVMGFYLVTEHTAHVFGILPYLFILACPLMHVFMHHGHGNPSPREQGSSDEQHHQ